MKRPYGLWDPSCSMLKPITWQVPPWPLVNDQNWTSKLDWRSKKEKEHPSQLANTVTRLIYQSQMFIRMALFQTSFSFPIQHW